MAQMLGEAGRYVACEASRKRRSIRLFTLLAVALLSFAQGMMLCFWLLKGPAPSLGVLTVLVLGALAIWGTQRWMERKLDSLEKDEVHFERGAGGERTVATVLAKLPESFRVINDLSTPHGNLDHVVVGPTGVFVLETKAWRGEVATGPDGELLLNGKPTDKPMIKQFVARAMRIRDKAMALCEREFKFRALMVFTAARVTAKWGTTRSAHCLREDQLHNYIINPQNGKRLPNEQVERIAQAFRALAQMDAQFDPREQSEPMKMAACH